MCWFLTKGRKRMNGLKKTQDILKFEAIVDFLKWSQSLAKGFFCHSFDIHEIWLICFSSRLNMIGTKTQYWNRQLIN